MRPQILNANFDGAIAGKLKEHAEDRNALGDRLIERLAKHPHVDAGWYWGSFGREGADDLSDLDIWVTVSDDYCDGFRPHLMRLLSASGDLLRAAEIPSLAPPGGGFVACAFEGRHGILQVDFYFLPSSTVDGTPNVEAIYPGGSPTLKPIFGRQEKATAEEAESGHKPVLPGGLDEAATDLEWNVSFLNLMLGISAKYLARDPGFDMGMMLYPKPGFENAVDKLGIDVGEVDWSVDQTDPISKVERLRYLVDKGEVLRRLVVERQIPISDRFAPVLPRYLDMVGEVMAAQ